MAQIRLAFAASLMTLLLLSHSISLTKASNEIEEEEGNEAAAAAQQYDLIITHRNIDVHVKKGIRVIPRSGGVPGGTSTTTKTNSAPRRTQYLGFSRVIFVVLLCLCFLNLLLFGLF